MQAWIPVVSWSLYFWKSVFSFRADSILKSDGYFISKVKVSRLRAFLWCMRQTIRDRDNNRRVRKHEKNSGDVFADWAQLYKTFFVPNQGPASSWIFGNGPVRVGTQGLFRPYLKTFFPPFLPTPLAPDPTDCPWVSEDVYMFVYT